MTWIWKVYESSKNTIAATLWFQIPQLPVPAPQPLSTQKLDTSSSIAFYFPQAELFAISADLYTFKFGDQWILSMRHRSNMGILSDQKAG